MDNWRVEGGALKRRDAVLRSFLAREISYDPSGAQFINGELTDISDFLFDIQDFVREVSKNSSELFKASEIDWVDFSYKYSNVDCINARCASARGLHLISLLRGGVGFVLTEFFGRRHGYRYRYRCCKEVEIFFDAYVKCGICDVVGMLHLPRDQNEFEVVDGLRRFVDLIRQGMRDCSNLRSIKTNRRAVLKNYNSLFRYMYDLNVAYPNLLVVRLDLYYERSTVWGDDELILAKKDLLNFLLMKGVKGVLEKRVGFIWKCEYSSYIGVHFNLVLFFDGREVSYRDELYFAKVIGRYWCRMAGGQARFFDYCFGPESLNVLGLKGVERWGGCDIGKIDSIAEYFTQIDGVLKFHAKGFGKVQDRGRISKSLRSKLSKVI